MLRQKLKEELKQKYTENFKNLLVELEFWIEM